MEQTRLDDIISEEIKKQTSLDDELYEPLTYDYLFKRHEGLPSEYFIPTDVQYNPNEYVVHTNPYCHVKQSELNERLVKTYPSDKSVRFVCGNLTNKGYSFKPSDFHMNCPNDDGTIYGHIMLAVELNYLNKEINDILINSFNTCGYYLACTFNRTLQNGTDYVVFQFEPKFQTNVSLSDMDDSNIPPSAIVSQEKL